MKKLYLSIMMMLVTISCKSTENIIKVEHETKRGIVVSYSEVATSVGADIIKNGGNAIDAAVATGFALAVTHPAAGNIGGGGFMVIRLVDGKETTIDYREKAPLAASRDMYLDETGEPIEDLSVEGYLAVGVPGSVAGMLYTLEKYGTMSVSDVVGPAVELARNGIIVDSLLSSSLRWRAETFRKYPSTSKVFLKGEEFYEPGDRLIQSDLGETLQRIADSGVDGFYSGKTAELIVSSMIKNGGLISLEDLQSYLPVERKPVKGSYKGYEIISMPPPSSGGVVMLEILNILEQQNMKKLGHNSVEYVRRFVEAAKYAYADRAEFLGDPDFSFIPIQALISKEYTAPKSARILDGTVIPSSEIVHGSTTWLDSVEQVFMGESEETTHYSVIDGDGNAVAVTTTINASYGSKVVVEGAGFLLNDEMDDFGVKPGVPNMFGLVHGEANAIAPGKRMLSSMTPTIVSRNGEVVLVTGSPGGARIITATTQVVLNVLEMGMSADEAVNAKRVHHQWLPDLLYYEKGALDSNAVAELELIGYQLKERRALGSTQTIGRDPQTGRIMPAPDHRRSGYAKVVQYRKDRIDKE